MLCANCGQAIAEGTSFCKNCGAPAPPPMSAYAQGPPPPGAAGAYGPGWPPPQGPPPGRRNRTGLIVGSVAAGVILLAALGVGLGLGLRGGDADTTSSTKTTATSSSTSDRTTTTKAAPTTTTEPAFAQKEGEIFLEPAGAAGPESFTGETFVPAGPPSTLNIPTTTTTTLATTTTAPAVTTTTIQVVTTTTAPGVQVASFSGDTPALYGGSKDKSLVDKEGQLRFFEQNPDKAAAFCAALNSDPTFKWSGGTQIEPSQLREYFAELTPVMLTRDTRVTNYGYRDGRPTPRQSVLQKGQLVLVDLYGVPRVRCECGNPLTPPQPVKKTPTYTGPKWPDFDPTVIIVIQPTVVVIENLVLVDIHTGDMFERPPGTEGTADTVRQATVWELTVRVAPYDDLVDWTAEITLNADGTLSGSTQAVWHAAGSTYADMDEAATGTWEVDAAYTVAISGTVETTAEGRVLHITAVPTIVGTSNWVIVDDQGDHEEYIADVTGKLAGWLGAGFVPMDLPAVDYGPVLATITASDGTTGSATLTALE